VNDEKVFMPSLYSHMTLIRTSNTLKQTLSRKRTMPELNLDMDVLRTLVAAQRLGSFHRAAREVGRSQSAVSQQLRRIEEQLGEPLFKKSGRRLIPTEAGEVMLAYAHRILGLNDEAVSAVRGHALDGLLRFGLPSDFAESWLPAVLGRFKRAHPSVRVEAVVDRNRRLLERLDEGQLDLVLALGQPARADSHPLGTVRHAWIGPRSEAPLRAPDEPLPLALFEAPCFFRQAALAALDRQGIAWRIAFVSSSLHGLLAAVEAGLGVTLRTAIGLPAGVRVMRPDELPRLAEPPLPIALYDGGRALAPAARQLRAIVLDELSHRLGALLRPAPRPRSVRRPRARDGKRPRSRTPA
jgi:DNA-binding transcriptional LysR family regulator